MQEQNHANPQVVESQELSVEEPEAVALDDLFIVTYFFKTGILVVSAEPWRGIDVMQATDALRAYLEGDPLVTSSAHPLGDYNPYNWRERDVWAGAYATLKEDHEFANFAWETVETRNANIAALLNRTGK